jgi:hypothetical protein
MAALIHIKLNNYGSYKHLTVLTWLRARVPSISPTAAAVTTLCQPVFPARAITKPPASPIVRGARPRRAMRCQGASRNRSHRRWAVKYITQGGPNVASALAIAPGTPPTFSPTKLIIRIMFGPGTTRETHNSSASPGLRTGLWARYRWFESRSLQQRVTCEPDFRHASLANHMLGSESWPGLRDQTSATPSLLAVGAARG